MVFYVPNIGPISDEVWKRGFMLFLDDDTEDAPWMVMGTLQWDATAELYGSLREYARRHRPEWFVASMLPVRFSWPGVQQKKQLAPDLFVAFAPVHPRPSFDVQAEGTPPRFVLEVVSPSSSGRDHVDKWNAYQMLEVCEYVLFTPSTDQPSTLDGYRLNEQGTFDPWPIDAEGRLWSEVLGLFLEVQGETIRAATADGQRLLTLQEAIDAAEREALARQEAEAELARLRQENDELRRGARHNDES